MDAETLVGQQDEYRSNLNYASKDLKNTAYLGKAKWRKLLIGAESIENTGRHLR